jgi:gas vesicle protein
MEEYEKESKSARGGGLTLFVTGCAVGAALGVLFAPQKGEETRKDVGNWLKERREKSKAILQSIKSIVPANKGQLKAAIKAGREAYLHQVHQTNSNGRRTVRA